MKVWRRALSHRRLSARSQINACSNEGKTTHSKSVCVCVCVGGGGGGGGPPMIAIIILEIPLCSCLNYGVLM